MKTQTNPTDKATARPWRVSTANDYSGIVIESSERKPDDRQTICTMEFDETHVQYCESAAEAFAGDVHDETKANAAFIVRACNHHAELVAALRNAVECLAVCAEDSEEAGYPSRAESVREDLKAYRAVLAKACQP